MNKYSQVETTGVEPMTFQNTGWTLYPLSYGGLMASNFDLKTLLR